MNSWIYLFAKFTPEALLFEAFAIFLLCCGYTAFWVLRKRRFGSVEDELPSGPVRVYLNELIANAEQLRLQLFGLLGGPAHLMGSLGGVDPTQKLKGLEEKMSQQAKALEALASEKAKMESELASARANNQISAPSGGGGGGDTSALEARIKELESRLAEYAVIEDDLANLKRLQQENAQLKASLEGKGVSAPVSSAPPPEPAPTPEPVAAPPPEAPAEPSMQTEDLSQPAAESVASSDEQKDAFADLASQVENSLPSSPEETIEPSAPSAESNPPSPVETPPEAAPAPEQKAGDPNSIEADLVAEFEKMLKS
jgi:hypothetical protein